MPQDLINLTKTYRMKKVLFLAVVGLVLFASCRKQRVCVCTYADGGTYTETYPLSKKKAAQAWCDANEYSGVSCELQ